MTESGIIYGEAITDFPTHMNYGKFIVDKLLKYKDRIALINGGTGEKLTFAEMAQQIVNTAASLSKAGVKAGDVVAICSENRMEYLIAYTAIGYVGGIATFINAAYSVAEMKHSMNISKPKYIFLSPNTLKSYYSELVKLNLIKEYFIFGEAPANVKITSFKELVGNNISSFNHFDFKGRVQTTLILYSSGTTGLPKGVKLTNKNLITSGLQDSAKKRDLVTLSIAPWSNTVGILCTMREFIYGQTVVFLSRYNEKLYLETIQKYKAGFLLAVPPLVVSMCKSPILKNYDVSSVEIIYSGGAPLDGEVVELAKTRLPNLKFVLQGYGMTEATGAITEETETDRKQGSVGKIVKGVIMKVVDVDTRKVVKPGERGEVCLKGTAIFESYIGKDMKDDFDEDGFYKTGDIAYYDENGFLFIVDRLKELIKYKAWQVAPSEIEALLLQHPAVKDVGVVGIPDPDVGEIPTGFVVKNPAVDVKEKELVDFVASKVSPWKQLRGGVKFVNDIPKTPSGKILRRVLRESVTKPRSKL